MKKLIFCIGLLFPLIGCVPKGNISIVSVLLEGQEGKQISIDAELACTPKQKAKGLMHRQSLPEGTGMLFAFSEEKQLSFWMKNTVIPLDILYFDTERNIVSFRSMIPCMQDSKNCPSYPSSRPAKYALEVAAGFLDKHAVSSQWTFSLSDQDLEYLSACAV